MVKACSQKFELREKIITLLNVFARVWAHARATTLLS